MRHAATTLTAVAVCVVVWPFTANSRVQSVERQVIVSVVDSEGSPVSGLAPDDFIVREDESVREVLTVRRDTAPKQIALLVDTSQAAGAAVRHFKRAAAAFVDAMREGNKISIISFGGPPRILADSTDEPILLQQGIDKIFSHSASASYLLDAVSDTTAGFVRRGAPRPIIVVLSTLGVDHSHANDRATTDRLTKNGIAMHTVVLTRPFARGSEPGLALRGGSGGVGFPDRSIDRDRFLSVGAKDSGGRRRDLLSISRSSADQALADLSAQLRGQYVVEYSRPGMLIPPEDIEVEVRRGNTELDVRATPVIGAERLR